MKIRFLFCLKGAQRSNSAGVDLAHTMSYILAHIRIIQGTNISL